MKNKRVTLEQIAKEINISRVTISKYLNGHGNLRAENRQAVDDALERYGYRQNLAAKTLAMNRIHTVGFVCFESPRSPYFLNRILAGVKEAENQFLDYGLQIRTFVTNIENPEEQLAALEELQGQKVDAIAIIPNDIFKPLVARQLGDKIDDIVQSGIPVITVNRDFPESHRNTYIGCDYVSSGRMAAELLAKFVQQGDILVALASRNSHLIDVQSRLVGINQILLRYPNIHVEPYFYYEGDNKEYIRHIRSFLDKNDHAKGLLDITYQLQHVAPAVQSAGRHLFVAGFDQYLGYEKHIRNNYVDCIVTQDMFAQGYQAINYIFQMLLQDIPLIPTIPIKNEIIIESNLESYE